MRFIAICLLAVLLAFSVNSQTDTTQQKVSLSGYLTSVIDGEALIGAKAYIPSIGIGVLTNNYGFYSLNVPKGKYLIEFRATGLDKTVMEVELLENKQLDVEIGDKTLNIEEVIVNAKKGENIESTKMGQIQLEVEKIKTLPAFFGEVDVIKTIQLLPGVNSATEGGQGFYVRGGGPDQNLVLLDEAVVYNAAHLFGFFSVFNVDAIKSVNLTKGGIPANFGGRMSSVLEVTMNEGNNKRFGVKGGLGLISSRITAEGPIKKGKGSFIASARRTYIDVIMKAAISDDSPFAGSSYFFYDFNFKANYRLSPKDKLFVAGYYGKDKFIFGNKEDDFTVRMPWGNGIGSIRWNRIISSKLFMNVTATFTDYLFAFGSDQDEFSFELKSGIRDYSGKVDFSYFPNTRHKIKWGAEYINHTFVPSSVTAQQNDVVFDTGLAQKLRSHESAVYALDEFDLNEKIKLNVGLRYSMYQFTGPFTRYIKTDLSNPDSTIVYKKGDIIQSYDGLEPRFGGRLMLTKTSSIKAAYTYHYQYVHLTSLSAVSLPTDIWFPTTDIAKPQQGYQATVGYFKNFKNDKWETSVEAYYKGLKNLIEYKDGSQPSENVSDNTDNLLTFGKGRSYGIEFFIKRNIGKLTGWIGYTLAKTERKFTEINEGNYFPSKYDRRHDVSVVGSYKLSDRWTFGAAFIYATGSTLTLPESYYIQNQDLLFKYGDRNSTRMAPYHRLDLSATLFDKPMKTIANENGDEVEVKKRFRSNWSFSIYNVYNRANPFFLYVDNDGSVFEGDFQVKVKQVTLFPIIPSVTWNFEF
ncbi:TonB-dependent receptor [Crocinitomicaceae bacterium]|nr:TonB-dependent receptor [Crocinitomicaceae bacterium]